MPLDLRCRMLSSEYCLRVSSNAYNPVRSCIFSSQFTKFFNKNPNHIRPLGLRVSGGDYLILGLPRKIIYLPLSLLLHRGTLSLLRLICLLVPSLSLSPVRRFTTVNFSRYVRGLQDYYHIYTDGSKMNNFTAAAAVGRDVSVSYASTAMPASSQQNWLLLTSLLILSDVPNVKNLPSSQIRYQVFWPLITVILKQVMCRNLSQITASYQTLEKALF